MPYFTASISRRSFCFITRNRLGAGQGSGYSILHRHYKKYLTLFSGQHLQNGTRGRCGFDHLTKYFTGFLSTIANLNIGKNYRIR